MDSNAGSPHSARSANRLVWVKNNQDSNIWMAGLGGKGEPKQIIDSTAADQDVTCSPQGTLAFRSDRSGYSEIWLSKYDGSSLAQVTFLKSFLGSPKWSPDGKHIAFDMHRGKRSTIWILNCDPVQFSCQGLRQVTPDEYHSALPSWSADSRFVYFASTRKGAWDVWKIPFDGGAAARVTTDGGYFASETSDGKWLYYSKVGSSGEGIWRRPAGGGSEEFLVKLQYRSTASWVLGKNKIYYPVRGEQEGDEPGIREFDLRKRTSRLVLKLNALGRGLALSPDNETIYYASDSRPGNNIVVGDFSLKRR